MGALAWFWLARPMLTRATNANLWQCCSLYQGFPSHVTFPTRVNHLHGLFTPLDISWVRVCVLMEPPKNSFVSGAWGPVGLWIIRDVLCHPDAFTMHPKKNIILSPLTYTIPTFSNTQLDIIPGLNILLMISVQYRSHNM